jgi:hypothetical protein
VFWTVKYAKSSGWFSGLLGCLECRLFTHTPSLAYPQVIGVEVRRWHSVVSFIPARVHAHHVPLLWPTAATACRCLTLPCARRGWDVCTPTFGTQNVNRRLLINQPGLPQHVHTTRCLVALACRLALSLCILLTLCNTSVAIRFSWAGACRVISLLAIT